MHIYIPIVLLFDLTRSPPIQISSRLIPNLALFLFLLKLFYNSLFPRLLFRPLRYSISATPSLILTLLSSDLLLYFYRGQIDSSPIGQRYNLTQNTIDQKFYCNEYRVSLIGASCRNSLQDTLCKTQQLPTM